MSSHTDQFIEMTLNRSQTKCLKHLSASQKKTLKHLKRYCQDEAEARGSVFTQEEVDEEALERLVDMMGPYERAAFKWKVWWNK